MSFANKNALPFNVKYDVLDKVVLVKLAKIILLWQSPLLHDQHLFSDYFFLIVFPSCPSTRQHTMQYYSPKHRGSKERAWGWARVPAQYWHVLSLHGWAWKAAPGRRVICAEDNRDLCRSGASMMLSWWWGGKLVPLLPMLRVNISNTNIACFRDSPCFGP